MQKLLYMLLNLGFVKIFKETKSMIARSVKVLSSTKKLVLLDYLSCLCGFEVSFEWYPFSKEDKNKIKIITIYDFEMSQPLKLIIFSFFLPMLLWVSSMKTWNSISYPRLASFSTHMLEYLLDIEVKLDTLRSTLETWPKHSLAYVLCVVGKKSEEWVFLPIGVTPPYRLHGLRNERH